MKLTKILSLLICLLMVSSLFVACKADEESTDTTAETTATTEAPETKPDDKVPEANDDDNDDEGNDDVPSDSIAITKLEDITNLRGKYHLTADIGNADTPNAYTVTGKFKGVLDGCGFTVYTSVPLFDELNSETTLGDDASSVPSEVKNLTIEGNVTLYGKTVIGALANTAKGETVITNVTNNAKVKLDLLENIGTSDAYAAGLVGVANMGATFENCKNTGEVTIDGAKSIYGLAGIVGYVEVADYVINNCENTGKIHSTNQEKSNVLYSGGIVGQAKCKSLQIENCKNSGEITTAKSTYEGNNFAGGILGCTFEIDSRVSNYSFKNCENTANIKSQRIGAGIAGAIRGNATFINCKNSGNITVNTSNKGSFCYAAGITADIRTDHKEDNVYVDKVATIECCSNRGNITVSDANESYAGGILGANFVSVNITDCANYGNLDAKTSVGGIIARIKCPVASMKLTVKNVLVVGILTGTKADMFYGVNQAASESEVTFTNCYNNVNTEAASLKGDAAKATLVGFDFDTKWQANTDDYPSVR